MAISPLSAREDGLAPAGSLPRARAAPAAGTARAPPADLASDEEDEEGEGLEASPDPDPEHEHDREHEAEAPPHGAEPAASGAHGWSGVTEPPQLRWSSRYAAGRLVPTSFLNSLIVAALRNPSLLRLVSMFARGAELRLRHVQVPPELLAAGGARFASVFLHMALRHRVIVVGVYRDARHRAAPLPYVVTNPPMCARIRPGDVLFVVVPVVHGGGEAGGGRGGGGGGVGRGGGGAARGL